MYTCPKHKLFSIKRKHCQVTSQLGSLAMQKNQLASDVTQSVIFNGTGASLDANLN